LLKHCNDMGKNKAKKVNINLLWTGGWDSTFQLLQLLLIYKKPVLPYYLIDEGRKSTSMEIKTMKQIKKFIKKKYPHTKELLKSTQYYSVNDILPKTEITSAYQALLKNTRVGTQYEYLARFCNQYDIKDMQLSIQEHIKPDPTHFNINPLVTKNNCRYQDVYVIDPKFKRMNEYLLFQYFSFPLIKVTKTQMNKITKEKGWTKIMEKTWFCHNPTLRKKPCGICKPCLIAIDEDFGWRIPPVRRIISFYYRNGLWPLKSFIKSILIRFGFFQRKFMIHSTYF